jgi:hypothetical protein
MTRDGDRRSGARHAVLHKDPHAYSAHAHIIRLDGPERLMVFNKTIRRRLILHPAAGSRIPQLDDALRDGGESWSAPEVVPAMTGPGSNAPG